MPHCNFDFGFYNLVIKFTFHVVINVTPQMLSIEPGLRNIPLNINYSLHVHSGILLPQKKEIAGQHCTDVPLSGTHENNILF